MKACCRRGGRDAIIVLKRGIARHTFRQSRLGVIPDETKGVSERNSNPANLLTLPHRVFGNAKAAANLAHEISH